MSDRRTALVTGSSRGIGRAIALRLAEDGVTVAVNFRRDVEAATAVVEEIRRLGGQAEAFQETVGEWERDARLVEVVTRALGPIDILVHNAGLASRGKTVVESEADEPLRLFGVHALAGFHLAKLVLPEMRRRARGDIVMISSRATSHMRAGGGPYNMAKAAVEALARTLANEEQANGVRVNVVAPALVATEMGERLARSRGLDSVAELDASFPFGRVCRPADVANLVAFLVSDQGSYISGQRIQVDGGGT